MLLTSLVATVFDIFGRRCCRGRDLKIVRALVGGAIGHADHRSGIANCYVGYRYYRRHLRRLHAAKLPRGRWAEFSPPQILKTCRLILQRHRRFVEAVSNGLLLASTSRD